MSTVVEEIVGIEKVTDLALGLSFEDRALLLDRLHDSLLSPEERKIEEAWVKEAARRAEEVRSGAVETIDADVVFAEARARFQR